MAEQSRGAGEPVHGGSKLALAMLVALALFAPWWFGAVDPVARATVTGLAVVTALLAAAWQSLSGGVVLPQVRLWPIAGLVGLGAAQLVPIPPALHRMLAPGSHRVWHPEAPAAAAILGDGWRPISIDPTGTAQAVLLLGGLTALALLAAPALADRRAVRLAAAAIVTGATVLAAYGIVARTLFGPLLYGRYAVPTIAPFGPFVSKNHFAGYVAMAALLALGLAMGYTDRARERARGEPWTTSGHARRVVLAWLAVGVTVLAVLVSLSRGGAVSLVAGLAAFVALRAHSRSGVRTRAAMVLGGAGVLLAIALAVAAVPPEALDRLRSVAAAPDRAGTVRLAVWAAGSRAALASPLAGYGLGAFAEALPPYKVEHGAFRAEHAENEYVELAVEGGLLALGCLLTGLALALRAGLRALARPAHDLAGRGILLGAWAALAAAAVHAAVDFNPRIPSNAALLAALFAIGLRRAPMARRHGAGLGTVIAALVAAAVAYEARRPLSGHPSAEAVRAAAVRSPAARAIRLSRAERIARERIQRRPTDPEPWIVLAWTRALAADAAGAASLATHAASLDPHWPELAREAKRLGAD